MLHTKYITCGSHGLREEDFYFSTHYKSMGANDLLGMARLYPRGLIFRVYEEDYYTLLHIGPHGFREDFFKFSHYTPLGIIDPKDMATLDPRGMVGRIYVGNHSTLLHTKYISCGPHGFREEFIYIFYYKSMEANDP